jgi:hypothetical protein
VVGSDATPSYVRNNTSRFLRSNFLLVDVSRIVKVKLVWFEGYKGVRIFVRGSSSSAVWQLLVRQHDSVVADVVLVYGLVLALLLCETAQKPVIWVNVALAWQRHLARH